MWLCAFTDVHSCWCRAPCHPLSASGEWLHPQMALQQVTSSLGLTATRVLHSVCGYAPLAYQSISHYCHDFGGGSLAGCESHPSWEGSPMHMHPRRLCLLQWGVLIDDIQGMQAQQGVCVCVWPDAHSVQHVGMLYRMAGRLPVEGRVTPSAVRHRVTAQCWHAVTASTDQDRGCDRITLSCWCP